MVLRKWSILVLSWCSVALSGNNKKIKKSQNYRKYCPRNGVQVTPSVQAVCKECCKYINKCVSDDVIQRELNITGITNERIGNKERKKT